MDESNVTFTHAALGNCNVAGPKVNSLGYFNGESSYEFALPALLIQIVLVTVITRAVRFVLRPLKQPTIISDIIGGIIIGPTLLGGTPLFYEKLFRPENMRNLGTFASVGTMYYLFIQGLKMDVALIGKSGIREVVISMCGMILPYITVTVVYKMLTRFGGPIRTNREQFLHFLSSSMSISAFPVINPILSELNLLNSELGRLALSTSLINDIAGWAGVIVFETWKTIKDNGHLGTIYAFKYLSCMSLLILFLTYVIRPVSFWIIRQTPKGRPVDKRYILATQFMVAAVGLFSDIVGATINNGPLAMGLAMPDGPPLASAIVEKTETIVQMIFLPLFFAHIGMRSDLSDMFSIPSSGASLQASVIAGYIAKLVGTIVPALCYKIPLYDAIALGFIMNFRGFVEVLTYSNWYNYELLGNSTFGIMLASTIVMTGISVPLVRLLAKKPRPYMPYNWRTMEHGKPNVELSVLTCLHTPENVPPIINLLQASNPNRESSISVYALTLVELVGRSNPILIEHNSLERSSSMDRSDHIIGAFRNFQHTMKGYVSVRPFTVIAPYNTMYQDICLLALNNRVSLMIVPFHKQRMDGMDVVDRAFLNINPSILEEAPCSVGILVDRGSQSGFAAYSGNHLYRVVVVVFGGPDCREVLSYALRMAGNPNVTLNVMRLIQENASSYGDTEKQRDEQVVTKFRIGCVGNSNVLYREDMVTNGEETVNAIRSLGSDYDLMVVGRRLGLGTVLVEGLTDWSENPELGVFGDIMAAPDFFAGPVSVLVMQQQLTMGW